MVRAGTSVPDLADAQKLRWGGVRATTLVPIIHRLIRPNWTVSPTGSCPPNSWLTTVGPTTSTRACELSRALVNHEPALVEWSRACSYLGVVLTNAEDD